MGSAPSVNLGGIQGTSNTLNAQQEGYDIQNYIAQEQANDVNQVTPFGNLQYVQTGTGANGVPMYTGETSLSPQEQYLLGTGQGTQGQAATQANEILTGTNYGAPNNIGSMTSGITGQLMGAETESLQPYFNQQTEGLESQLANQGLTPTDPAYQAAMNNMLQSQNQSVAGFVAQAEPQAFGQAQTLYQEPLQIAESLYQEGTPGSLTSNLVNTPQNAIQVPNVASAYSAASAPEIAQAQLQEQQYGSMMAGIGQLGGALGGLMLSDERYKKDIEDIASTKSGLRVVKFKSIYDDSEHVGMLATDVARVHPDVVHTINGTHFVDYDALRERGEI